MSSNMPPPAPIPADILNQNKELRMVIEQQKLLIENLQKQLAVMTDERNGLLERNHGLEQAKLAKNTAASISSEADVPQQQQVSSHEMESGTFEIGYHFLQQEPSAFQAQQHSQRNIAADLQTSKHVTSHENRQFASPQDTTQYAQKQQYGNGHLGELHESPSSSTGPVPPPRSPYRQHSNRENNNASPTPNATNSSTSNNNNNNSNNNSALASSPFFSQENEGRMGGATIIEPSLPATYTYERPRQPSPSPARYPNRDIDPRKPPNHYLATPSINTSGHHHHHHQGVDPVEKRSERSVASPADTIVDKDAQLFAKYQDAIQRKENTYNASGAPAVFKETTLSPPPVRKPAAAEHHQVGEPPHARYERSPGVQPPIQPCSSPYAPSAGAHRHQETQDAAGPRHQYDNPGVQHEDNRHYQYQQQQQQHSDVMARYREEPKTPVSPASRGNNYPVQTTNRQQQQQHSDVMARYREEPKTPVSPASRGNNYPVQTTNRQQQQQQQVGMGNVSIASIVIKVIGSHTFTNDKGKEVIAFTISVRKPADSADPDGPLKELWRVQKLYSDFLALDTQLKAQGQSVQRQIAKLPDKTFFSTHAPSKVDQRKMAIERYLQHALSLPLADVTDLCEFLSSNVIDKSQYAKVSKYRQGYLTKRGKNFGGWKSRYFVLDGPELKYYESEDGPYLGSIRLTEAQVGAQVAPKTPEAAKEAGGLRHALMIVEPKKSAPGGLARHVLCAESDAERDAWVEAISQHIDPVAAAAAREERNKRAKKQAKISKEDIKPVTTTDPQLHHRRSSMDLSSSSRHSDEMVQSSRRNSIGHVTPDALLAAAGDHESDGGDGSKKKEKANRKTFWAKKMFSSNSSQTNNNNGLPPLPNDADGKGSKTAGEQRGAKQVFGVPLEEAIRVARVSEKYELPAIVYRCIDYLEAKDAIQEEGIYRLSGSAVKIRSLKNQFNEEGDVDLLASGEHHDVHAVAGLLKMWFRELPENVLTNDLLKDFLSVMDLVDRRERINELGRLVSMLPLQNYTLLRTLSAHLIRVVQNAGVNKMTMRNIGIVFSATLGIPAGIFSLLLTEFDYIFWTNGAAAGTTPGGGNSEDGTRPEENNAGGAAAQQQQKVSSSSSNRIQAIRDDSGRSNRNSVSYMYGAPKSIVGLERKGHGVLVADDEEVEDLGITPEEEFVGSSDEENNKPPQYHPQNTALHYTPQYF